MISDGTLKQDDFLDWSDGHRDHARQHSTGTRRAFRGGISIRGDSHRFENSDRFGLGVNVHTLFPPEPARQVRVVCKRAVTPDNFTIGAAVAGVYIAGSR